MNLNEKQKAARFRAELYQEIMRRFGTQLEAAY
jgi:hypothetical protein